MAVPGNLVDLALDAFGKYVFSLCNLMSTTKAEVISNRISNMLAKTVPVTLADKMTNMLLDSLDHWIFYSDRIHNTEVCVQMVRSIIHPGVTRIQAGENFCNLLEFSIEERFQSTCCVKAIIKNVHSLTNLKALDVHHNFLECNADEIDFPTQLVEFSGLCNNEVIDKLAKSCKFLRVLNVSRSRNVTDESVSSILKVEHLEKLNISETKITNIGILRLFRDYINIYGKSYSLRYLVTSVLHLGGQLNMFAEYIPNLKIIICRPEGIFEDSNTVIENFNSFNFQNVIGLDIKTTIPDLKEVLQNMGNQLTYLSVHVDDEGINPDDESEISEMFPIGQYCTRLKFLKLSWSICNCPVINDTVSHHLPGFQTVSDLVIDISWAYKDYEYVVITDIVNFLLYQCVNVKKVMLPICIYSKYDLIKTAIEMGCLRSVELMLFQHCCNTCCFIEVDDDGYDQDRDNVVQMLFDNCPNLEFIRGVEVLRVILHLTHKG